MSRTTDPSAGRGGRTAWAEDAASDANASHGAASSNPRRNWGAANGFTEVSNREAAGEPAAEPVRRSAANRESSNRERWKDGADVSPATPRQSEPSGPSQYMVAYDEAVKEYKRINSEYQNGIKRAESAFNRAKKDHAAAVSAAQKLADDEKAKYEAPVGKFARATLYIDAIAYGRLRFSLIPDATSTRILAARDAMRDSLSYPNTIAGTYSAKLAARACGSDDASEQRFIEVTSGDDILLIQFNERDEQNARLFASNIVTAAQNLESARRNHEERMANFQDNVQRVSADISTIQQAERDLADAKADTHDLEAARTRVDFARAAVPTLELEARRHRERRRKLINAAVIAAIVVVVALAIVIMRSMG